jgi:hypothetical protein
VGGSLTWKRGRAGPGCRKIGCTWRSGEGARGRRGRSAARRLGGRRAEQASSGAERVSGPAAGCKTLSAAELQQRGLVSRGAGSPSKGNWEGPGLSAWDLELVARIGQRPSYNNEEGEPRHRLT